MSYASTLGLIAALYLLAAASPGPNFFIISQLALDGQTGKARGVAAAIALGSTIWAASAIAGMATLLAHGSALATAIRWLGAAYLVWYGARLLLDAAKPAPANAAEPGKAPALPAQGTAFRIGLLTSLTNPKAAAFWTGVFATTLPAHAPLWLNVAICAMIALLSAAWHLAIATVFSRPRVQRAYGRARRPISAVCGSALVALGLRQGFVQAA